MDLQNILQTIILEIGQTSISLGQLVTVLLAFVALYFVHRFLSTHPVKHMVGTPISTKESQGIVAKIKYILITIAVLSFVTILGLDNQIFSNDKIEVKVSTLIWGVLIIQLARFLDWIISKVIIHNVYLKRDKDKAYRSDGRQENDKEAGKSVQWLVYILAILIILNGFQIDYTLFAFENDDHVFNFKISNIFRAFLIFFIARLGIWVLTQIILYSYYRQKKINIGSQYAINQLLKYVIYFVAVVYILESFNIEMTLLLGGAAALLVGVGLGLQQTFNDFISGIIMLFERSVEVGDVLEVAGMVGTVKKIGLRASLIETRANTTVVVPNSKLVVDSVVNWSHFYALARFDVTVGVAYGTDTDKVKELLLQSVHVNPHVLDYPSPFVRFSDFGDSALIFQILFFSRDFPIIEDVKSDIRFEIDRLFREHDIVIPFPQRVIWNAGGGSSDL